MITRASRENAVERELVRRVEAAGGICQKVTALGARGFPDRLVLLPGGRIVLVECKKPRGGRLSPHQAALHTRYRALGATIAVVKDQHGIDSLFSGGGASP